MKSLGFYKLFFQEKKFKLKKNPQMTQGKNYDNILLIFERLQFFSSHKIKEKYHNNGFCFQSKSNSKIHKFIFSNILFDLYDRIDVHKKWI